MLPRDFPKFLVFGLVFLILIVLGSSYYLNKQINTQNVTASQPAQRKFPLFVYNQINNNISIIYQGPNDEVDRTVFYKVDNPYLNNYHNGGIGEIYEPTNKGSRLLRVIGSFLQWKTMSGSKDRYMLLENPENHQVYTSVRVSFEPNPLLGGRVNAAELDVENISTGKIESMHKLFMDLTPAALNNILKPGDAAVIYTMFNVDAYYNNLPLLDSNGFPFARNVIIRRTDGLSQVSL